MDHSRARSDALKKNQTNPKMKIASCNFDLQTCCLLNKQPAYDWLNAPMRREISR